MELSDIARRWRGHTPGLLDRRYNCAVLVPLVRAEGGLRLLFEVRAGSLRRQPGEVCFPGGRMEPGETAEACALRETWEELGIPQGEVEPLGSMDFVAHPGGYAIYPILGAVGQAGLRALRPNPAEVAEAFTAPLDFFLTHPPRVHTYELRPMVPEDFPYADIGFPEGYDWRGGWVEVPVWHHGGHVIWGITARIVRGLAESLRQKE